MNSGGGGGCEGTCLVGPPPFPGSNNRPSYNTRLTLMGRDFKPTPYPSGGARFTMDWNIWDCKGDYLDSCSQMKGDDADEIKSPVRGETWESMNDGPWYWAGDPHRGSGVDQIYTDQKSFRQKWFINGQTVQLVVGATNEMRGPYQVKRLMKVWEVQVNVNYNVPQYSPVVPPDK